MFGPLVWCSGAFLVLFAALLAARTRLEAQRAAPARLYPSLEAG